MRSISSVALWLFVVGIALSLGAGLYENLVVVPFWSTGAPGSLAEGNPLLEVQVRAGRVFWSVFTPGVGFMALLALATSFGTPPRHLAWRVAASGLFLMVSIATLVYFRPTIIGMVVAEFFTAITGLGAVIVKYGNQYDTASMFVPILVLMLLGIVLTGLVQRAEEMFAPWRAVD